MDATKIPKEKSPERHTDGRPVNIPGIYVHKDTGAKYITSPGEEGTIQADALMDDQKWRGAWEWTGDVPTRQEILVMQKAQLKEDTKAEKTEKAEFEADTVPDPAPGTGATFVPGPA